MSVPYRWLPSTIIPNLKYFFKDIYRGVKNVIKWIPVIWYDREFDWVYLTKIMEYKLRRMSKSFKKYGWSIYSDKQARQMLICAELLKRLMNDDIDDLGEINRVNVERHNQRMKEWQQMLGKYIGKYLREWWD